MSVLWSRTVPPPTQCPNCHSERISLVLSSSPEVESWRCLDCKTKWEIGAGGQVVVPRDSNP